ncbi:MAG: hypothetical protein EA423_08605 [Phycisphaerales bacterium]|nr:MAG: hypothetical protein EA423_08605 [Phycisphaerales bacterium]
MNRSSAVVRPYVRRRTRSAEKHSAGRLAALAGRSARPAVERLEPRQLLFTLEITPESDLNGDGIGVAAVIFGYSIPYLNTNIEIEDPDDPEIIDEDFGEETPRNIPSGTVFDESNLRVRHNLSPATDSRIIAQVGPDGPIAGTEALQVITRQEGRFMSFEFLGEESGLPLAMQEFSFFANRGVNAQFQPITAFGLPYNDIRLELLFDGQVIDAFTGTALRDFNIGGDGANIAAGVGEFFFSAADPRVTGVFDEVRLVATANNPNPFRLDDFSATLPFGIFNEVVTSTLFGAEFRLVGPIGARATITDLYQNPMVPTIRVGVVDNVVLIDRNLDGIPDFNAGIGRVVLENTDSRTNLTVLGGTIEQGENQNASFNPLELPDGIYQEGTGENAFIYTRSEGFIGLFDQFEQAGFGYAFTADDDGLGLPPGQGSVIIGSPFLRNPSSTQTFNPGGPVPGIPVFGGGLALTNPLAFNNPAQGIFVNDGSSMGRVAIHGVVHGSSRFTGAVDEINIGYMMGSTTVDGDLGAFIVASDAGLYVIEDDATLPPGFQVTEAFKVNNELVVGRSLGEFIAGGRSLMDITVVGDINDPANRPPRDILRYREREFIWALPEGSQVNEQFFFNTWAEFQVRNPGFNGQGRTYSDQGILLGSSQLRNDVIDAAEWVGSLGTAVEIRGEVGFRDPSFHTAVDVSDVFGFAVDGTTPVVVQSPNIDVGLRIVDTDGRTVAAGETQQRQLAQGQSFVFEPEAPGVYYLVVYDPDSANERFIDGVAYTVAINGMAPTTLGSVRTGAGTAAETSAGQPSVTVLNGSWGIHRVGTGYYTPGGDIQDPEEIFNTNEEEARVRQSLRAGVYAAAGNLYGIWTGADIDPQQTFGQVRYNIGGNLGMLFTGRSELGGDGPTQGDVSFLFIDVGGDVGTIDISGGIGYLQPIDDGGNELRNVGMVLRTGRDLVANPGATGSIGMIRAGAHMHGVGSRFVLPDNATLGAFLISQDIGIEDGQTQIGIFEGNFDTARFFQTGVNADIRFMDFPRIDLVGLQTQLPIIPGQSLELTDDRGGKVSISVTGVPSQVPIGVVRIMPIDNSVGVAIANIEVNLAGGRNLNISGVGGTAGAGPVSIGRIDITNATAQSNVNISGNTEIDVYRIVQTGGTGLNRISNTTLNGDIVAIDVIGLNELEITRGSLGRTQVPAWGPRLIGPELGIQAGLNGDVGGPIGISGNTMSPLWNGTAFRPVNSLARATGPAALDDIGGPFGTFLNGVVVREGNVQFVRVARAMGDVRLQGGGATLVDLQANSDNSNVADRFDGIVGVIYAPNIGTVEIGDGLAQRKQSPIATTGIFAENELQSVEGGRTAGASIRSVIAAANNFTPAEPPFEFGGIEQVRLRGGGDYDGAQIFVAQFDSLWVTQFFDTTETILGVIGQVDGQNADFFRSSIRADELERLDLTNGFFDASNIELTNRADAILATGFRNSTRTGSDQEFRPSTITIGGNIQRIETKQTTGVMSDLLIDIIGDVRGQISAGTIARVDIQVDGRIERLIANNSLRASRINTGEIRQAVTVTNDIASSEFRVAGLVNSITAGGRIFNSKFTISGSDGRLNNLQAGTGFTGEVVSAGPVARVVTLAGDMVATIRTTTDTGVVGVVQAGRDLVLNADISGGVSQLVAGRHIGRQGEAGVILVRGNLFSLSAPNGQLYADVRVGGTLGIDPVTVPGGSVIGGGAGQAGVTIGRGVDLPGNRTLGGGSIEAFDRIGRVTINGDFGGNIISYSRGIQTITINNGSLLQGRRIAAFDGSIESLTINNGSLLGSVFAGLDIVSLSVTASNNVFGNVGVNQNLSPDVQFDNFRSQVPTGTANTSQIDGPQIHAGRNIVNINISGQAWETGFYAGERIQQISIGMGVLADSGTRGTRGASYFAAGDRIGGITIGGNAIDVLFVAGVFDLGFNNRPGGVGPDADTVRAGVIDGVSIGGNTNNVDFVAGLSAGANGVYNSGTAGVTRALGVSEIRNVSIGSGSNVIATRFGSENIQSSIEGDGRFSFVGVNSPVADSRIFLGAPAGTPIGASGLEVNLGNNEAVRITLSGPGQATWDAQTRAVRLSGTTLQSSLRVESTRDNGRISNFNVYSRNDASLGTLNIVGDLRGDSSVVIDGEGGTATFRDVRTTGDIRFGGDVSAMTFRNLDAGFIDARRVTTMTVNGRYGDQVATVRGEAKIDLVSAGTITINGRMQADINIFRSATRITVNGVVDTSLIRVGRNLGAASTLGGGAQTAFSANAFLRSRLSVADQLGNVAIAGDMTNSSILIGGDLGANADYGGSGINADRVGSGFASNITVGGNFFESDIVAGALRGPDRFFGTADDRVAPGRSRIGNITITGSGVGSNRSTESFRISSTGTIGTVNIGGALGVNKGNFAITRAETQPVPIQVADLRVTEAANVFTARLTFNQPIDAATLSDALSVRELRGATGSQQIFLVQGLDYTISYDEATNTALVRFERSVTERNLPQRPAVPGPGVYRFELSQDIIRGQIAGARLDGNGDGFAGDNFSKDAIVGDVGDRLSPIRLTGNDVFGNPIDVDFYGPANLNLVMDNNYEPDGLPDVNVTHTIRGRIGNHPDHDLNFFRFGADADLYSVTLQAGQFLRLSNVQGIGQFAEVSVLTPSGDLVNSFTGPNASNDVIVLPGSGIGFADFVSERNLFVQTTGTYIIAVANLNPQTGLFPFQSQGLVNFPNIPGTFGDYRFDITVYDDGNSGFNDITDAGSAKRIVNAPRLIEFAGPDGELGTADDVESIVRGGYVFTRGPGMSVVGSSPSGDITSTRQGGRLVTDINGSIGPRGHVGIPGDIFPDIDVYLLNNGQPIQPGTLMTITVRLNEFGADLGSRGPDLGQDFSSSFLDFSNFVQFALFDTTGASGLADASLLFSPSDFSPTGGTPGVIADNGINSYGFDENGDFYITFAAPGRADGGGLAPASYAIYLQGVFNTDYSIRIVTEGTAPVVQRTQNVFIELQGGNVNWLEAGNRETTLTAFDPSVLGLVGSAVNGQPIKDYIVGNVVSNLESLYARAGVDVRFSTNPRDFEFQDFSTVFLSNAVDPKSPLLGSTIGQAFGLNLGFGGGILSQPFGFAQRSDPLNIDQNDEAVVFVPSHAQLGFTPSAQDVDNLITSITASVSRHLNELMGLRVTANNAPGGVDVLAANAPRLPPPNASFFQIPTLDRALSNSFDSVENTIFWIGRQNSGSLLDRILAPA